MHRSRDSKTVARSLVAFMLRYFFPAFAAITPALAVMLDAASGARSLSISSAPRLLVFDDENAETKAVQALDPTRTQLDQVINAERGGGVLLRERVLRSGVKRRAS